MIIEISRVCLILLLCLAFLGGMIFGVIFDAWLEKNWEDGNEEFD